jgi:hypothetical protein
MHRSKAMEDDSWKKLLYIRGLHTGGYLTANATAPFHCKSLFQGCSCILLPIYEIMNNITMNASTCKILQNFFLYDIGLTIKFLQE